MIHLSDDYEISAETKKKQMVSEIPVVIRPIFPEMDSSRPGGFPEILFPHNLDEFSPKQLLKDYSLWTGWAVYTTYLLAVAHVEEISAEDVYQYHKRTSMDQVENDVKKDLVEARAERKFPHLKEFRKKYQQARAWRVLLGGHAFSKSDPGGISGMFRKGADAISRAATIKSMDLEAERMYGKTT